MPPPARIQRFSLGPAAGIDRLFAAYPEFTDDAFVAENLARGWRH